MQKWYPKSDQNGFQKGFKSDQKSLKSGPNGGQGYQKALSKKHQTKWCPKWAQIGPKGGPKMEPNRQNEVFQVPCFKGGSQEASRAPPGSILKRFWDHFRTIFVSFSDIFWWFVRAFCSSMLQTKTFKITRNHQKNAAESFQETASLFVPSCIEQFTSER